MIACPHGPHCTRTTGITSPVIGLMLVLGISIASPWFSHPPVRQVTVNIGSPYPLPLELVI